MWQGVSCDYEHHNNNQKSYLPGSFQVPLAPLIQEGKEAVPGLLLTRFLERERHPQISSGVFPGPQTRL